MPWALFVILGLLDVTKLLDSVATSLTITKMLGGQPWLVTSFGRSCLLYLSKPILYLVISPRFRKWTTGWGADCRHDWTPYGFNHAAKAGRFASKQNACQKGRPVQLCRGMGIWHKQKWWSRRRRGYRPLPLSTPHTPGSRAQHLAEADETRQTGRTDHQRGWSRDPWGRVPWQERSVAWRWWCAGGHCWTATPWIMVAGGWPGIEVHQ